MGRRVHHIKSLAAVKRDQVKEMREFKARQKRELAAVRRSRRAETIYHKTGKWPKWFS